MQKAYNKLYLIQKKFLLEIRWVNERSVNIKVGYDTSKTYRNG